VTAFDAKIVNLLTEYFLSGNVNSHGSPPSFF
jgi:hypothetical protein